MNDNKLIFKKKIISNFGVGLNSMHKIFSKFGINKRIKVPFLNREQLEKYTNFEKSLLLNKDLKLQIKDTLYFKQTIKCYSGIRNMLRYPSRGQRTHTNARTKKKFF